MKGEIGREDRWMADMRDGQQTGCEFDCAARANLKLRICLCSGGRGEAEGTTFFDHKWRKLKLAINSIRLSMKEEPALPCEYGHESQICLAPHIVFISQAEFAYGHMELAATAAAGSSSKQ